MDKTGSEIAYKNTTILHLEIFWDIMLLNILEVLRLTDTVNSAKRSQIMSRVRGKDTKPELLIRRELHAKGFRYRLHDRKLPGKPDLVFPKYKSIIFIHGCFWHGHSCHMFRRPSSHTEYWNRKFARNIERDKRNYRYLEDKGWRILTIWECALSGRTRLPLENVIDMASDWLLFKTAHMEIRGHEETAN